MQLDKTRILIRERGYLDLLDLALRVIRAHAWPLAVAFAIGVVPAMWLNSVVLDRLLGSELNEAFPGGYLFVMLMLVLWEIPLVTAPATLYLGRALFVERPRARDVARDLSGSLPQLFLLQVVVRGILVVPVVTWFFLFAVWPYLTEVILLDRNPLTTTRRGQMTTYRRMNTLHGGYTGELMVRWLGGASVAAALFLAVLFSIAFLRQALVESIWSEWQYFWTWEPVMYTFYYPLALWLVACLFAVVRFLGYLDLRIRREGWEVELLLRAEGARLTRQLT